jgi:hypothetical protein
MGKVSAFNFVTLDGYFEGHKRDISFQQEHLRTGMSFFVTSPARIGFDPELR